MRKESPTESIMIQWAVQNEGDSDKTLASGKGIFGFLPFYRWEKWQHYAIPWYKWKLLGILADSIWLRTNSVFYTTWSSCAKGLHNFQSCFLLFFICSTLLLLSNYMLMEAEIWHNINERIKDEKEFLVNKNSCEYSNPLNFC